jgi:phosphohistidine phosphatase SixA
MSGERPSPTQLYLLRHADAGDPEAWTGDDAERPLSPKRRGAGRAPRDVPPWRPVPGGRDHQLAEVRARQTAEIVADGLGGTVRIDDRLGGAFEPLTVDEILADAGAPKRVVLVGTIRTSAS